MDESLASPLSVLIERADRGWTAEVLEHDLATQFGHRDDAGHAIGHLLAGHIACCEDAGVSPWWVRRAPPQTWRKFLYGVPIALELGEFAMSGRTIALPRVEARVSRGLPRRRSR